MKILLTLLAGIVITGFSACSTNSTPAMSDAAVEPHGAAHTHGGGSGSVGSAGASSGSVSR